MAAALRSAVLVATTLYLAALASAARTGPTGTAGAAAAAAKGAPTWGHELGFDSATGVASIHPRDRKLYSNGNANGVELCAATPDPPLTAHNLVYNADFSKGAAGWNGLWSGVKVQPLASVDGYSSIVSSARQSQYAGPTHTIPLVPAGVYQFIAWVRLTGGGDPQFLQTTLFFPTSNGSTCVATAVAKSSCWTKVQGGFTLPTNETDVQIRMAGPNAGANIELSSVSITLIDQAVWRAEQDQRIDRLRKRNVVVKLVDALTGTPVEVLATLDQTRSAFPFGAAMSGAITLDKNYQDWYAARFNFGVMENELKWYYTEPEQGKFNYKMADAMLAFADSRGIAMRGHNIFWDVAEYVQSWVKALPTDKLKDAVSARLNGLVSRYAGRFKHWDVNNEMLHGNYYESTLGPDASASMFKTAKALDPPAKLFVNDFNVVEACGDQRATPEAYLSEVWQLAQQGATVDAIGIESHFYDPQAIRFKHELDQLALAGVPLWVTELDVSEADPQAQADKFEIVMREAFSHEAVGGIMQWEVARPPCSVYYADYSKCLTNCTKCLADANMVDRPIGERYVRLRKEWSTHVIQLSVGGTLPFRGFFGDYRIKYTKGGKSSAVFFTVPEGKDDLEVTVKI